MRVTTAAEMQALDRLAVDTYGIPGVVLMENAGAQVARILWQAFPRLQTQRVAIFCGRGNNGGDGFVIARYLSNAGVAVTVFLIGVPEGLHGDARTHFDIMRRAGVNSQSVTTPESLGEVTTQLGEYDILIDALLGTGLKAEVHGLYGQTIAVLNASRRPIVAVDIPSGLSADTGVVLGEHVRADLTITIALPKRGLLLYPAAAHVGRLVVVDIGFPAAIREHASVRCHLVKPVSIAAHLTERPADTHKGSYGHLLVVAGSLGKTGAGVLACLAALRSGAGLVSFGLPGSLNAAMEARLTETMTIPLPEVEPGVLGAAAAADIVQWLEGKSCLILGPGLGTHRETVQCVHEVLRHTRLPVVLDADGLNAVSMASLSSDEIDAPLVLTPHPGELARLRGTTTASVQADRLRAAGETARACHAVVVLKGAHTIIAEPDGTLHVNLTGNPGMATAGSGDVLSGVIGAFLGQGYAPSLAAQMGVYLHGLSGDLAAAALGTRSLIARDLIEQLPRAFQQITHLGETPQPDWEHYWLKGKPDHPATKQVA